MVDVVDRITDAIEVFEGIADAMEYSQAVDGGGFEKVIRIVAETQVDSLRRASSRLEGMMGTGSSDVLEGDVEDVPM